MSNLIRSLPQLLYNHIKDSTDEYWQWFLVIRQYFRFIHMPKLTDSQVNDMDKTLEKLMNIRMRLTRVHLESGEEINISKTINDIDDDEEVDVSDDEEEETNSSNGKNEKVVSKYKPTIKWKEHFLSHFSTDIRNLAPLPLTNTNLFESKE